MGLIHMRTLTSEFTHGFRFWLIRDLLQLWHIHVYHVCCVFFLSFGSIISLQSAWSLSCDHTTDLVTRVNVKRRSSLFKIKLLTVS